jgi:hypothetical protein
MKRVMVTLLVGMALNATPAFADDEGGGCFQELARCYNEAAKKNSWIERWLAGLDCELDFIECTRIKLIGT